MTQKILFTREHPLDEELRERLERHSFEVCHLPLITCQANPLPEWVLQRLPQADWLFFTSAVAVDFFAPYIGDKTRIATIGHQTSKAVQALGHTIDFESTYQYATEFAKEWLDLKLVRQTILLPQSSLSNPVLADTLRKHGHDVIAWPLYDTKPNTVSQEKIGQYLIEENVLWTYASPSAWQSFYEVCPQLPETHQIAVIGTSTAKAVLEAGQAVHFMPDSPSVENMVEDIIRKRRK
ncbi:uroporphyrinogen-III synthase [Streptococcus merionis]|uniref:Uroporphyrinogen-III synthase n=1 Tax=Streptococcus merionis TaxID=400065 RepID=A0A239SPX6_9STRE|nr:uroporphyrinogen-III synthase [Streptococcus merionis]SNU86784.1 uroporphyrinogen-III synthase [Streptococcus merionis]